MTEDRYQWLEGQARNLDRMPSGSELHCYCPGDCNCRFQGSPWNRPNYCGCKQHEQPTASERIRAAREAQA